MLRLDVERLKGELAAARPASRTPVLMVGRYMPTPEQAERALERATARMPADATCGGPGRCGRIGCGHPGWGH